MHNVCRTGEGCRARRDRGCQSESPVRVRWASHQLDLFVSSSAHEARNVHAVLLLGCILACSKRLARVAHEAEPMACSDQPLTRQPLLPGLSTRMHFTFMRSVLSISSWFCSTKSSAL